MKVTRLHVTAFLGAATAIWGVSLWVNGIELSWALFAPFSLVVGALVGAWAAFERSVWRWRWLHGWFVKRPDLSGTWKVVLQSSYIRPGETEPVPPIICYMAVTQSLTMLQMKLMTPESSSVFIADRVRPSPAGDGYQVIGVYTNEPSIHLRDARISEMHQGALLLETHGAAHRPDALTGKYWTDRKTVGSMTLGHRVKARYSRFADADRAFSATGSG
ncbi:MAG: hypothetical protein OXU74_10135 [Gemmatimonadota bacterium]|nr:hypothetical protein [Gemmatimonadota bacterium]